MLLQRVITAIVLLLILLPTIFLAPARTWGAVSLAFLAVAAWEWARLLGGRVAPWRVAGLLVLVGLLWLTAPMPHWAGPLLWGVSLAWWLTIGVFDLSRVRAGAGGWPVAALLLLSCWVALLELRVLGALVLIAAMAIVWIADIGAYFVGRSVGRHKLAPRISPGKSWEGAIGGAVLVVLVAWATAGVAALSPTLAALLLGRLGVAIGAIVLAGVAGLSVVGDLHESLLKRQAGVKDSGRILPGHGGVLDRIDALIPTMPLAALLHGWLQ